MDQGKSGGMEGGPGDQRQVFDTIEPIANEGAADGSHMNPKLMGPACFGPEPQQGKGPLRFQNLIMGHSRGTVRADHPSDGRTRVPSNRRVNGPLVRHGTPNADRPVFPPEVRGMEASAEQVVDVAAFGNDHKSSGALIQAADGMKDKLRAS